MLPEKPSIADVAARILNEGGVDFSPRKLKYHETHPDAPLARFYMNLRGKGHKDGQLTPELLRDMGLLMGYEFQRRKPDVRLDFLGPVPIAGNPLAEAMAQTWEPNLPLIHLDKEELGGGKRRIVPVSTDRYEPGWVGAIVDDVISQALSKIEAADAFETLGVKCPYAVVVLDRKQGGTEQMAQRGIEVVSLFDLDWLLNFYVEAALMTSDTQSDVYASFREMAEYQVAHPD